MNLQKAQNIYMVGIKGVGMTALALILKEMGKNVWGSDILEEFPTDQVLRKAEIKIVEGFKKENVVDDIDLVITTGAHEGLANVEVLTAKGKNIPVFTHAEALGSVMDLFSIKIAVCGSHGKTTVSAMIAYVLYSIGLSFGYHVGTPVISGIPGGGFSGYDFFVTEADEYINSKGVDTTPRFMFLNPDIIICTNLDFDHPDVFSTLSDMENAFFKFFQKLDSEKGALIYYAEDKQLANLVSKLNLKNVYSYSLAEIGQTKLTLPGRHNLLNASAVVMLAGILKLDKTIVKKQLSSFSGSSRRFEKIYEGKSVILYDDYAHHPTEIEATIDAFREKYPKKRLVIIFQSHTYSRTQALEQEFIKALSLADYCLLTDIFPSARENSTDYTITSQKMVEKAQLQGCSTIKYCPLDLIAPKLKTRVMPGDIVVTMGAGSLYQAHSDIIEVLKHVA